MGPVLVARREGVDQELAADGAARGVEAPALDARPNRPGTLSQTTTKSPLLPTATAGAALGPVV